MPLDRSAALVLWSVINWTYCSCTGNRQILLEIWPEPDLAGFPKNCRIPDLPEPESKSDTTLTTNDYNDENVNNDVKYNNAAAAAAAD